MLFGMALCLGMENLTEIHKSRLSSLTKTPKTLNHASIFRFLFSCWEIRESINVMLLD